MYKYEIHLHTSACSACAVSSGEEMVVAAKENGYAGIVLTNHFYHGNTAINRSARWEDFVGAYKEDYLKTKKFAKQYGIDVLFGIEEGYGGGKEVLIYGVSPEKLIDCPDLRYMRLPEISEFVHSNNGFIAYAHPFRNRIYIKEPDAEPDLRYVDAIEVYNKGNPPEDNQRALEFAKSHNVRMISGGDVHKASSLSGSGLVFNTRIKTSKDLVKALFENEYSLITDKGIIKPE